MSTRYNNGSHYENHKRAAELHEIAAHAHLNAAEEHGKEDHLTGSERSRQALEYSQQAYRHSEQLREQGISLFGHREIEECAYSLWQARGCPQGSPEVDWYNASHQLRARVENHPARLPGKPQPLEARKAT